MFDPALLTVDQVRKLPTIPFGQFERCEEIAACYFMQDDFGRVWYIGQAHNLRQQLVSEAAAVEDSVADRYAQFTANHITTVAIWSAPSDGVLAAATARWLELFDPPLNDPERPYRLPVIPDDLNPEQAARRFMEIKAMITALQAEAEALKPNVVSFVEEYGTDGQKIEIPELGKISLSARKNWRYSSKVEALSNKLKQLKKEEERNGTATVESVSRFPTARGLTDLR
ncbi:MAG: hypothetical protein HC910_02715 [Spirulinaceae cyanobacterium SM2_1_0]|nr:hypothetical protein [Spirulinaceae cyanobacterium SM2_1_0]